MKKIFAVLCFIGSALLFAAPAFSHSTFVNSTPKRDAVVKELPSEFRLEFNEDLLTVGEDDPNKLIVTNSNGKVVSGKSEVAGPYIFAPKISTTDESGRYKVEYRIVSADGHVVEGSFQFTVDGVIGSTGNTVQNANQEVNTQSDKRKTDSKLQTNQKDDDGKEVAAQHHEEKVVDEVKEPQQHESHESFIHVHADHIIMALIALGAIAMWFLIARSRRES